MLQRFINVLRVELANFEARFSATLGLNVNRIDWQPVYNVDLEQEKRLEADRNEKSTLDSVLGDGFLWGVPTQRRSIERRLSRTWAVEKQYKVKRNILVCAVCGHYHEAHTICGNCYEKVKAETQEMQDAIQEDLKLDPVDKEVAIVYQNGKRDHVEGKRIVEMKKPPPPWFSKNLLTKEYIK